MALKTRMTVNSPADGMNRYSIIKETIHRYNESLNNGYFLEALTLAESLIADRLESHICSRNSNFAGFKPLGHLTAEIKKDKTGLYSSEIHNMLDQIDKWKDNRNHLLHELAKIDANSLFQSFGAKYATAQNCAKEGLQLFNAINKIIKKDRSRPRKNNPKNNPTP